MRALEELGTTLILLVFFCLENKASMFEAWLSVAAIQIFKYTCEYFSPIIFLFVFAVKYSKNNIFIFIQLRFRFWIIFVLVFVQKKIYLLHSGVDPGRGTKVTTLFLKTHLYFYIILKK